MKIFAKPLFAKHDDFETRKDESKRRGEQMAVALSDIDFDVLPEAATVDDENSEVQLANAVVTATPADEITATKTAEAATVEIEEPAVASDTYVLDSFDDTESTAADNFKLPGYIASTSRNPNYIKLFDAMGNVVYDGSRAVAIEEFAALTPEELAGIYGSGDNALVCGLTAIDILLHDDDTGIAQNLLQQNSSLYASYTAFVSPQAPRELGSDALTMLY